MPDVQFYRQAERIAARVIDGVAFVVGVDLQMLVELNEVGTFVWEKLAQPSTLDSLASQVANEFDVEDAAARRDVDEFVQQLVDRGLVVVDRVAA